MKCFKKIIAAAMLTTMIFTSVGCGKEAATTEATTTANDKVATSGDMVEAEAVGYEGMQAVTADELKDGEYDIEVDSSSSMFKIVSCKLTVKDGVMTALMTMGGTGYKYLYMGTGEEATAASESDYIPFIENEDGSHSFEVPVEALDSVVKCTAFSKKKEKWYDRDLCFRADSLPEDAFKEARYKTVEDLGLSDGEYTVDVKLAGGSGKASVTSPAKLVIKDGKAVATIEWSSPNYDYMIVDGEKYLPVNDEGNSVFEIPVKGFDTNLQVSADTTAMSKPYEIEYTLYFDSSSLIGGEAKGSIEDWSEAALISGLSLSYAEEFSVDYYGTDDSAEYPLISITGEDKLLVVPKGCKTPSNLDKDIQVIEEGAGNIYAASSASLDLFRAAGALRSVSFVSTKEEDWSLDEVKDLMKDGSIKYVGKYSSPDYETILDGGTSLAVENMMIYHKPEVKEELEKLGITVLVDHSSYEKHPLGRLEWVKLYGIITGKNEDAAAFFDDSMEEISSFFDVDGNDDSGQGDEKDIKTVAYFYIATKGYAVVRKTGDYIPKMIDMAGGKYVFDKIAGEDEDATSTMNMDLETFYSYAKDADIIIYDTTIDADVETLSDLTIKHPILYDFKAVESGNVWYTGADMYQQTSRLADMIKDMNVIVSGGDENLELLHHMD